jgi:hypothetical protein
VDFFGQDCIIGKGRFGYFVIILDLVVLVMVLVHGRVGLFGQYEKDCTTV